VGETGAPPISWRSPNFLGALQGALPGHIAKTTACKRNSSLMQDSCRPRSGESSGGQTTSTSPGVGGVGRQDALNASWASWLTFGGILISGNIGTGDLFHRLAPSTWETEFMRVAAWQMPAGDARRRGENLAQLDGPARPPPHGRPRCW